MTLSDPSSISILLAEDEIGLREEIADLLSMHGFKVEAVSNGRDALESVRRHPPTLIISDVMMPYMDGYDLLEAVRADEHLRHIPFLFLTARAEITDRRRGMRLGAEDYLTKPFTLQELIQAIEAQLEKAQQLAQPYTPQITALKDALRMSLPHELRTPLFAITGLSEILMMDAASTPATQVAQMADEIERAAHRLLRLVENYLLAAYLDMNARFVHLPLSSDSRVQVARPAELIGTITADIAQAHLRPTDLNVALNANSYSAGIQIDPAAFSKLLYELVDNAFKFSPVGTAVHLSVTVQDDHYRITIRDHGPGLDPAVIDHVGTFTQFDRSRNEQQGAGLGLAIAQRLVNLAGGRFVLQNYADGLEVALSLPLAMHGSSESETTADGQEAETTADE